MVTGASGQVGVDVLDVLRADATRGDPMFQPDGRPIEEDEFDVLGLNHHELDVSDATRCVAPWAPLGPTSLSISRRTRPSTARR